MKKLYVAIAALAWAGLAQAGEYHRLGQLRCSDCHTMHASRAHSLAQNGTGQTGIGSNLNETTATANPYLLIASTPTETCLACHEGQGFAPDVVGGTNSCTLTGCAETGGMKVRSAGFLNEVADGAPITNYGHTLETTSPPPGFTGTWAGALECSSCHAVHGSRAFRNAGLGRNGSDNTGSTSLFNNWGATYTFVASALTPDTTVDVSIESPDGQPHPALAVISGQLSRNEYRTNKIAFGKGSGNAGNDIFTGANMPGVAPTSVKALAPNGMNSYCGGCHGQFHSQILDGSNNVVRHPTTDHAAGAAAGATVFSGTWTGADITNGGVAQSMNNAQGDIVRAVFTASARNAYEAGCLSCHKAHGNARVFGLLFPDHTGTSVDTENGDALPMPDGNYSVRQLCVTCHSMGRSY